MKIASIENTGDPLRTPNGEVIWELVGHEMPETTDRHSLAHVKIPVGKFTLNHYHPVAEETYYILKGQGRMVLDGEESIIGPGDSVYIAPNQHHKLTVIGDEDLDLLAVCVPAWEPTNTVWLEEMKDGEAVPVKS